MHYISIPNYYWFKYTVSTLDAAEPILLFKVIRSKTRFYFCRL